MHPVIVLCRYLSFDTRLLVVYAYFHRCQSESLHKFSGYVRAISKSP